MPADPTIPELVARLRELHEKATPGPWSTNHRGGDISARIRGNEVQVALACGQGAMWDERDDAAAIMRANAELIAELRSALPAILDALDHVGDAAAHSPDGGKEEGEPGFLSSDGVCPFCNCYADTPHTWRDCAHDLRETAQGLAEQAERVTRDSVAAISRVRGRLAEFRLRVSEAAGCTRVVTDVTPEPFTVAASDDVALGAIRDLKERSTWRPIEECGELEAGEYLVRMKRGELAEFQYLLITIARWSGAEWQVRIGDAERYYYRAEHITHVHQMGPIRGPEEGER